MLKQIENRNKLFFSRDNNATYSIDAREAAPNRAHPNLFAGSVDASKKG